MRDGGPLGSQGVTSAGASGLETSLEAVLVVADGILIMGRSLEMVTRTQTLDNRRQNLATLMRMVESWHELRTVDGAQLLFC